MGIKKVIHVFCVVVLLLFSVNSSYASTVGSGTAEEPDGTIISNLVNLNFATDGFQKETDDLKTVDSKFVGTIGIKKDENSARIEQSALKLSSTLADITTYKGGLSIKEWFGIECRIRFDNTSSIREVMGMKGIVEGGSNAWPVLLNFNHLGEIKDSLGEKIGNYQADVWYTVRADINTDKKEYRVWIKPDNGNSMFVKQTLSIGGSGERIWFGCQQMNLFKQKKGGSMEIASINAGSIRPDFHGIITGNITNLDFSNYTFSKVTATEKTIDTVFTGIVGFDNDKTAELVTEDRQFLRISAIKGNINTYKAGLKLTENFGLECRVRFGDTVSKREIITMKGMAEGGNYAWPSPLRFSENGKIISSDNREFGTYEKDTWYTVKIDFDTENKKYRVWVSDGENDPMFAEATLSIGGSGDKVWRGCQQTNVFKQVNQAGSSTPNTMDIAYLKVGSIQPTITHINVNDIQIKEGEGKILSPTVTPENAFRGQLEFESADPSVVKVFENGLLALNEGTVNITVRDSLSGISSVFKVEVEVPEMKWELKSIEEKLLGMVLWSGFRVQIDYNEDQIKELFAQAKYQEPEYYKNINDSDFINEIEEQIRTVSNPALLKNNKHELLSRYLVLMYHATGEWGYARKSAMILYYQSQYYPRILQGVKSEVAYGENIVYAFGYMIGKVDDQGKSVWESIAPMGISGEEVEQTIAELYFRPLGHESMNRILGRRLGNLDVYAARSSAVTASILNDPYLIRKVIMMYDGMFDGSHYYFDGMWEEGTTSYGGQVSDNAISGIKTIEGFTDPEGYSDPTEPGKHGLSEAVMGLNLSETDLTDRWALLEETRNMSKTLVYPDGSPIAINDTHYKKTADMESIQSKLLKNVELPGFGYYGLVQGNEENAVHASLLYQASQGLFGGSHDHINLLSMTLWGAGTELLPDVGYVTAGNYETGGGKIRYPAMRPIFHNMPWILRNDGKNEDANLGWFKPRLLAYDDGNDSGGIINLVEGSDVGADVIQADVNQRLLMNVKLDESHSYVFDLSRMQGGDAHEIFQRGSELENMEVITQGIELRDMGIDKLSQAEPFKKFANSHWTVKDMAYLNNPKEAEGSSDFSFTWKGETTGSSITTHMNGVPDSKVYMTSIPTPRRITSQAEEKIFVAPHITRYSPADESQLTKYGAVHEPVREGEDNQIEDVEWIYPDQMDDMGILGKITTNYFIDYIYTSGDTTVRSYDGMNFAGKIAMVRKDRETKETLYSYVYGQGKAEYITGATAQKFKVTAVNTAPVLITDETDNLQNNTITVAGVVEQAESFIGKRVQLVLGDGSGYGVKIKDIEIEEGKTILTTEEFVPIELKGNGCQTVFHPHATYVQGQVWLILEKPSTKLSNDIKDITVSALPSKTVYELGEIFVPEGLVISLNYEDGRVLELKEDEYELDSSDFSSNEVGRYTIKAIYTEDIDSLFAEYTAVFEVYVVENLEELYTVKIEVDKVPKQQLYEVGSLLDTEGLVIKRYRKASASNAERAEEDTLRASMSNAVKPKSSLIIDILDESEYDLDYNFSTPGKKLVQVSYTGKGMDGEEKAFLSDFEVTVLEKEETTYTSKIKVTKQPNKKIYNINEDIDLDGLEVTAYLKASGSNAVKTKTLEREEYEVEHDFSTSGTKNVTISYMSHDETGERKFVDAFMVSVKSSSSYNHNTSSPKAKKEILYKWNHDGNGWKLFHPDGSAITEQWAYVFYNGRKDWYRVNKEGYIMGGWFRDGENGWYYLHELNDGSFGAMTSGWKQIGQSWYYFNEESDGTKGMMKTGWIQYQEKWYFLEEDGRCLNL